jgi:hypothetical protein
MAMTESQLRDHLVHEAEGPPFTPIEAAAAIGVGVVSLMAIGVVPVLLGALAEEHRLSQSAIGLAAMLELLSMGLTTGLAGMALKPRRLIAWGVGASLALTGADLVATLAAGPWLLAARAGAGAAEGVLLWITVGMIARTATPERWAGIFFTTQVIAQFVLAVVLGAVIPIWGANGGLVALAGSAALGVVIALGAPKAYPPLPVAPGEGGAPPPRGWFALAVTLVYVAAGGAVAVYLQPLAREAGLDGGVARTALSLSLAAQVAGGAAATALAGRVRYFTVFLMTSATSLTVWWIFSGHPAAWLFIGANMASGLMALFLGPFIVPMTIDADPSRRAGMQSGAAQLFGGALGPLLAAFVVGDRDVHGVLWLGVALLFVGTAGVAWLRFTSRPNATRLASVSREA